MTTTTTTTAKKPKPKAATATPPAAHDLTTRAMLVRLTISQWTARKYDRRASEEVARAHACATDAGRYNKALIARTALAEITRLVSAARTAHYALTLPWTDEGTRLLSSVAYFDYTSAMSAFRQDFERATAAFVDAYPQLVEDARSRLGSLFSDDDYPDSSESVRRRFGFDVAISPLPAAGDFRVSLSEDECERVREDIERRNAEAVEAATRDVWTRVHDAVQHMHERLRAYAPSARRGERTGGVFRDSLVDNLRELTAALPLLNVTGDPTLDTMARTLERELCGHDAETLRADESVRESTADAAERILRTMAAAGYVSEGGVR